MTKEIMQRNAADNEYLHKDFYGALSCGVDYLKKQYGPDAVIEYLHKRDVDRDYSYGCTVNMQLCKGSDYSFELESYDPQTGASIQRFYRKGVQK